MKYLYGRKEIIPSQPYGISSSGDLYEGHVPDGVRGINYPPGFFLDPNNRRSVGITEKEDSSFTSEIYKEQNGRRIRKSIEVVRSEVGKKIKDYRDAAMFHGGVYAAANWFHSDSESRGKYLAMLITGTIPEGKSWKVMNGSFVELTSDIVREISKEIISNDAKLFQIAEGHLKVIKKLSTAEEVAGYNWRLNWLKTSGKFQYVENSSV